jgi:tRNA pseudouridine55 synthase
VPTLAEVESLLVEKFTGEITQVPPKYSALKIDGQRAYDLARKGEEVIMKERQTEVKAVKVLSYNFPEVEIELSVAAGFYVRSFANDLGAALCGGGLCSELRRIGVGELNLETGDFEVLKDLTDLENLCTIDPQLMIKNIVHVSIDPARLPDLQAGRAVFVENLPANGEKVLVVCEGVTVGMAEVKEGNLQPRVVF